MKNLRAGTFQEFVNTFWQKKNFKNFAFLILSHWNWFPQTVSNFLTTTEQLCHACYQLICPNKQKFWKKPQTFY